MSDLVLGCVATTVICLVLFLVCSFSSLEFNEFGLDYSSFSKTVQPVPYESGVHMLGLGHHFLKFPKTVKSIEFSNEPGANAGVLQSRTSDGLQVTLEISFQYKLQVKDLFKLFTRFGMNYETVFHYQSIDVLTDQATKYTAYDFFVDRINIGQAMQQKLDKYFQQEFSSTIEFFQLRKVDLPDQFENSIQETEVKKQSIQKAQAQKQKIEVELKTKLMEAEYQAKVTVNLAEGEAKSIRYEGESRAKAFKEVQAAYSAQYKNVKSDLGITGDGLNQYMKAKIVRDFEGESFVVNLGGTSQSSKKSGL